MSLRWCGDCQKKNQQTRTGAAALVVTLHPFGFWMIDDEQHNLMDYIGKNSPKSCSEELIFLSGRV
jgi:hypothetical protein